MPAVAGVWVSEPQKGIALDLCIALCKRWKRGEREGERGREVRSREREVCRERGREAIALGRRTRRKVGT